MFKIAVRNGNMAYSNWFKSDPYLGRKYMDAVHRKDIRYKGIKITFYCILGGLLYTVFDMHKTPKIDKGTLIFPLKEYI